MEKIGVGRLIESTYRNIELPVHYFLKENRQANGIFINSLFLCVVGEIKKRLLFNQETSFLPMCLRAPTSEAKFFQTAW